MIESPGRIYETHLANFGDGHLYLSPRKGDELGKIVFNFTGNEEAYYGFVIGLCIFCGNNQRDYVWQKCDFSSRGFISGGRYRAPRSYYNDRDFRKALESLAWPYISNTYFISIGDTGHSQNFVTEDPVNFMKGFALAKIDFEDFRGGLSLFDIPEVHILQMHMINGSVFKNRDICESNMKVDPNIHVEIYDLR